MREFFCLVFVGATVAAPCVRALEIVSSDAATVETPRVEVLSSDAAHVRLQFELPQIVMEDVEVAGREFRIVSIPGGVLSGEPGEPAIPTFARFVAIPDEAGVRVTAVVEETEEFHGCDLIPMQADEGGDFAYDEAAYAQIGFTQAAHAGTGRPAIFRDLRVVPLTFRPVRYDPARHTLSVAHRMRVDVTFEGRDPRNVRRSRTRSIPPSFDRLYRGVVVNYDDVRQDRGLHVAPGTYLVICQDIPDVINRLAPLVQWRQQKGTPVYLATTTETGSSNAYIKAFIQEAYETWELPPEYIVLVGDATTPYRIATWYETFSYYNGEGDHPYTRLDGDDMLAEAHIGRLSFSTLDELEMIVSKMVGYERTPYVGVDPEWYTRACLAGDPNTPSGYSPVEVQQWIKIRLRELGYTQIDTVFGGSFVTEIRNSLNNGVSLFSYRGYYGMSGWSNTNIAQLTNGWEMPFCVTITCDTGSFASGTSRTEMFLRVGTPPDNPKGGIGAIGTATLGTHTRYNNCMHYGIFRGLLWEDQYEMGAALTRGKLELYMNYSEVESTRVEIFSHWNNLIGDPAGEVWTAFPETLVVSHPPNVPLGTNVLTVSVQNGEAEPMEGAQVCLWKGDETYVVGLTDAQGLIELPVTTATGGSMQVTVTRHNHRPYTASILVMPASVYAGYESHAIDDDDVGTSAGNGDGQVNPGEAIELPVQLRNFGLLTATDVTATLTTSDPYVTIVDETESFGDIPGGGTSWSEDDFDIVIDPSCPDGHRIRLGLDILSAGREWRSLFELDVVSADLVVSWTYLVDGQNGILDPGETADMTNILTNLGQLVAVDVVGTLVSLSPFVTVVDSTGAFGTIAFGGHGQNSGDPFTMSADPGAYEGHQANFLLVTEFSEGLADTGFVTLTLGERSSDDPVGPDRHGHYAFDNTDTAYPEAPVYDWIEIDTGYGGDGTDLGMQDNGEYMDDSRVVDLPFPFQYYGTTYDRATICSNGWLAMGETYLTSYRNWTIPGAGGPNAMLAVFWDDLFQYGGGKVFHKHDTANHRWIVEWSRMRNMYNYQVETFEAILYDPAFYPTATGDGVIVYQYETVNVTDPTNGYVTVGIESPDQSDGVLYTFFNQYPDGAATLIAGRAIRFVTPPSGGGTIGVASGSAPDAYALMGCRPNPFNPMTTISYQVPVTVPVRLRLYDVAGRLVVTLVDDVVDAGRHAVRWDGRTQAGAALGSGVYFVRLEAPGFTEVREVTLVR